MNKLKILLLLFTFSTIGFSQTQNYPFTHISTTDGLSQSSAIVIEQDNLGQIWIGTRDGLNKYDGTKFTVYRNSVDKPNSISNNDILSIKQDSEGYIWIGTYNGLNKYNPKTNAFTRYFHSNDQSSLVNNTIWTIEELSNGAIWVGTSNGISVYDKSSDSFKSFLNKLNENDFSGNQVLSILETKNNSVYIGTSNGLIKVLDFNQLNFEVVSNTKELYIQDIVESLGGNLLLATRGHSVLVYHTKTKEIESYLSNDKDVQSKINARQLQYDDDQKLWIGTYSGLVIVDKKKNETVLTTNIKDSKSLSKNSIKSIFKDKKGSIWIGTYYGGINVWDVSNKNFVNIIQNPDGSGLSYNVVSSIENYKDYIYFGTEGGGITRLNKNNNSYSYINENNSPQLLNDNIKSLHISKNDNLWIGTFDSGLVLYNPKINKFNTSILSPELMDYLSDVGIYAIKEDANSNIWLGTFGKGLVQYSLINKTFDAYSFNEQVSNSLSSNLVRTIEIDSKENIWVGTEHGLNKVNPEGNITTYFYEKNIEAGDDVLSIYEANDQTIWVGTKAKGLYKLIDSKFQSVDLIANETIVSSVHSILEDKSNNLWISTNQGLVKFNPETNKSIIYDQKEGLVSNEFNDNSSLKVENSKFYFGGPSGVTFFNPQQLYINDYAPQVIITDFKIKQKSVDLNNKNSVLKETITFTEDLELAYNQGNFSVAFAVPNFINSNNNRYKYRLKGLEDDWVETTENNASYTIQNAGDYVFEVKGANSDGIWNENPTQLIIKVAPAPWRSWWAFLIYGVLILGALYFLMHILKSRTKLQTQLELEHLEVERTKEANKAKLEFFTNISHEFRTPLTLITGPLHQILEDYKGSSKMYKKLMIIESSANQLLQLINRLMDFRKLENNLLKLESAEGNFVKFLKEIYLSFSEYAKDRGYDYSFHTSDDEILVYYDRYKLERVFYNLISNAFRYTPHGGKITIKVKKENEEIIIQVEDSGVGIAKEYHEKIFDRFFEVATNNQPDDNYSKGTGIGLSIAKNIVDLHKGKIDVRNNESGEGSIFSVVLPLGCAHLKKDEIIRDFKFSDDISQYVKQLDTPNQIIEDDIAVQPLSGDKQTILLVEDHNPLRKFMRSILEENYNILEAQNGKLALKIAQKESPNLIVSDVIMPVMVGTELCSAIKGDIKTSHIPIILLTSRTSLIYKLEGLESGADDYISKPFDVNEFKLRIKNLLESTSRLKQKYTSEDPLQPNEIMISSLDEKLYKKALQIVEDNIGNEEFDVQYFCTDLGVSRTMLFTKVKAWTNFTPNEFIMHFRMKRAAQILEQGKINISEVSYKVGFRNPKYFSKCFQKKFGETPTQYTNRFSSDY
ncbi:hybrid sensor histidine kinase/response regulator transcription factor [uncultured Winogradskyella sp.]|uniref:hybrid sensor histidine kinase/response regulator transcription factor n=1 Tax=uncultured Winogradskyella sp. TaxID=395353 RepID=UPI002628541F|nr:hybrid sensor histidine kinase/response regulator transcription factor [uncultured Winogradskyella sp.]